jgi:hypothetical protein
MRDNIMTYLLHFEHPLCLKRPTCKAYTITQGE